MSACIPKLIVSPELLQYSVGAPIPSRSQTIPTRPARRVATENLSELVSMLTSSTSVPAASWMTGAMVRSGAHSVYKKISSREVTRTNFPQAETVKNCLLRETLLGRILEKSTTSIIDILESPRQSADSLLSVASRFEQIHSSSMAEAWSPGRELDGTSVIWHPRAEYSLFPRRSATNACWAWLDLR